MELAHSRRKVCTYCKLGVGVVAVRAYAIRRRPLDTGPIVRTPSRRAGWMSCISESPTITHSAAEELCRRQAGLEHRWVRLAETDVVRGDYRVNDVDNT